MIIKQVNVKNLLVKTRIPNGDYVINPYIGCTNGCKYCYAVFMKRFTNIEAEWGNFLIVKKANKPLDVSKLHNHTINIGTVTDGYVWQEKKYEITRSILKQLINVECKIIILTKNDLVLRDIDILRQLNDVIVAFSINTTDENFKQDMDNASPINKRFGAIKILKQHKIKTAIFIAPIFPKITDWKNIILKGKDADEFWFEDLNLRQPFKNKILAYIYQKHYELAKLYKQIYDENKRDYWITLAKEIELFCIKHNVKFINFFHHAILRKK